MIIPFFLQKQDPGSPQKNKEEVIPYEHEANIADGGEFLDDGIRMKDQPFGVPTEDEDPRDNSSFEPDLTDYE
jgi:hypothetical protein